MRLEEKCDILESSEGVFRNKGQVVDGSRKMETEHGPLGLAIRGH